MKAMVITGIGGPEVFALADVPRPVAGPGQLLVQVQAAGVNPIDCKLRQSGALGVGAGAVLGFDVAGVVEAVGPGVTAFAAGDKVFYSPGFGRPGAYAECNVVDASIVAKMPASLDFVQAAAVPLAGMTALGAVYTRGQVRVGQTVCVSAVNGGVGMFAVQICQAAGAYVFGTCSTRSLEFVEDLGAVDRIIDYQREDWAAVVKAEAPRGLDLMFDCVGQDYLTQAIGIMRQPTGQIVTIVNPQGQLDAGYRRNVTIHYEFLQRSGWALELLATLIDRGQIDVHIDEVFPLAEVAQAHRKLEAGGVKGKIVLEVA